MTSQEPLAKRIPIISEHDTWISVDPVIGCPASCAYCYLGPIGLTGRQPRVRLSAAQAVELLRDYLRATRDDLQGASDATPICLGNYTDMLMTEGNRRYLLEFARQAADAELNRPLVVVSKGNMPRDLAESLDSLGMTVLIFHTQSFHRTTLSARTERGPVLAPEQTFELGAVYAGLTNVTPVHFWRPITRETVPSADWATEVATRLKAAGFACSVAIGLAVGVGVSQSDLVRTGLLTQYSAICDEKWDEQVWRDISQAAKSVGYPVYRSTSCAIALATRKPESLGVWDARRGAADLCLPCNCPTEQRYVCESRTLHSGDLEGPLSWISRQLGEDGAHFVVLPGRRVRVAGEFPSP